jgi:hypothetical protein
MPLLYTTNPAIATAPSKRRVTHEEPAAKLARFAELQRCAPHLAEEVTFSGGDVVELLCRLGECLRGETSTEEHEAPGAVDIEDVVLGGAAEVRDVSEADADFVVRGAEGGAVLEAGADPEAAEEALCAAATEPIRQVVAGAVAREMARIQGKPYEHDAGDDVSPSDFSCSGGTLPCVVEDILFSLPSQDCFSRRVDGGGRRRCRAVKAALLKGTDLGRRMLLHASAHEGAFEVDVTPRWRNEDGTESRPKAWVFAVTM